MTGDDKTMLRLREAMKHISSFSLLPNLNGGMSITLNCHPGKHHDLHSLLNEAVRRHSI